ncbi:MAG: CotH kinase family protein [Oscillospiraceae bacterium]|nr:CotH kinase family protein [Oscillospiraceae bacterium]
MNGTCRKRTMGRITVLLLLALAVCLLSSCRGSKKQNEYLRFLVNGEQEIRILEYEEKHIAYVFLPSYAELDKTILQVPDGANASIGGIPLVSGMDCGVFETDREYPFTAFGSPEISLIFLKSANVATLYFKTEQKNDFIQVNADKEYTANISVQLYTADGTQDYLSTEGDKFSGRGNSTWFLAKKPYNLKLSKAADLLGMGEAKKWSLLANGYDESNLRNKLVLDFAARLGRYQGFAPDCAFADLYVNGEYNGLYLICKSTSDTTDQFLDAKSEDSYEVELTVTSKMDPSEPRVRINKTMSAEIKVPEKSPIDERDELADLMDLVQAWITSDEQEPAGFVPDYDSLARKILIETIFENYDGATASQYFWGDLSEKSFHAGPCWDYDLAMGNYFVPWTSPRAMIAFKDWNLGEDISWYHGLWNKTAVRTLAEEIYRDECRDMLTEFLDRVIPEEYERIAAASELDWLRWPSLNTEFSSPSEAVEALTAFMRDRVAFLNSLWIEKEDYCLVTMRLLTQRIFNCYVPAGEPFLDLPDPSELVQSNEDGQGATEWRREDTGELFDATVPVTEDLVIYAARPKPQ